ncbi:MAG: type II toxin-antitoxin system RelE/ParE family toxin [Clostridiales bacterium]|jgi:addiction module RelE/StbE family toxin|nr:type II toxin-antitoxin system RelE/ParE family toxin [Clostridiales bacterium]
MPNKATVKLLPKARGDLTEIFRYIGEELKNPVAALALTDKFYDAFERLEDFPLGCPVCKTETEYRKLVVDNYIAFYKYDETKKAVIIFRILYGMMNYDKYI